MFVHTARDAPSVTHVVATYDSGTQASPAVGCTSPFGGDGSCAAVCGSARSTRWGGNPIGGALTCGGHPKRLCRDCVPQGGCVYPDRTYLSTSRMPKSLWRCFTKFYNCTPACMAGYVLIRTPAYSVD